MEETKLNKKEIELFKTADDIRQITFLGARLVDEQCDYKPEEIAQYAIEKGYGQQLGYLAEISLEAARKMKIGNLSRLEELLGKLPRENGNYKFLFPYQGELLKRLVKNMSDEPTNQKWKVYSCLKPSDVADYIELYLIDLRQGNYVKVMRWKS